MTVPVADNKILEECDGIKTDFSFSFKYFNNSDIKVYIINADDTKVLQTEGVDYTLSSTDKNTGGTVTFAVAPADDKKVLRIREMTLNQETPFRPNTNFPEQVIEACFDKLTMITQQLAEVDTRCLKLPLESTTSDISLPEPEASKALKWNATLDGFENSQYDPDEYVALAEAFANAAEASADLAVAATGSVPTPVALNYLRQNSDASGFEYRTPAQVKSDIDVVAPTYLATCSTAAATAEKAVTISGVSLSDGLSLLIKFANANTASPVTINLNAGTARALVDKRGNTPVFSNKADEQVHIIYDATNSRWVLVNAEFYSAKMGVTSSSYIDITLGTSGSTYTAPADGKIVFVAYGGGGYAASAELTNGRNGKKSMNGGYNYGENFSAEMDCLKGDVITYEYGISGLTQFRFYYLEGSKP